MAYSFINPRAITSFMISFAPA